MLQPIPSMPFVSFPSAAAASQDKTIPWIGICVILGFIPVDILGVFTALYSGFTWMFILIWFLFALKIGNVVAFCYAKSDSTSSQNKAVLGLVFLVSAVIFFVAFLGLIIETVWVTKDIKWGFMSPFVWDLMATHIASVVGTLYAKEYFARSGAKVGYYYILPQKQQQVLQAVSTYYPYYYYDYSQH